MDLNAFVESLQKGLGAIPPIAIGLVLLAGPTVALIGYRVAGIARRTRTSPEVGAAPLWVCNDCRSVNELRVSRCYRCGLEHDLAGDVEIVVEPPAIRAMPINVPAGSPFAAVVARGREGPGVPVMVDPEHQLRPIAVGPGREYDEAAIPSNLEPVDTVGAER